MPQTSYVTVLIGLDADAPDEGGSIRQRFENGEYADLATREHRDLADLFDDVAKDSYVLTERGPLIVGIRLLDTRASGIDYGGAGPMAWVEFEQKRARIEVLLRGFGIGRAPEIYIVVQNT